MNTRIKQFDEMTEFNRFWEAYPIKRGKGAARKAYAVAIKKTDLPTMLKAIDAYKANKPPRQDYCHPSTWLNQERWDDEWTDPPSVNRPRNAAELSAKQMMERQNGPIINGHANEGDRSGHGRSIGGAFLASIETIGNG